VTTRAARRKSADRASDIARRALALEAEVASVIALPEFRDLAADVMEPAAFDYVDGGAWDELTLADNEAAWLGFRLRPRVLVDVSRVDPSARFLDGPTSLPVAIAPMAAHGLASPIGEVATAAAAAAAGIPFTLSTMSTRSIEEVAAAAPDGIRWFQLYAQADPRRSRELVERAAAAGYRAIVLTVDLPVLGFRERDRRNGFDLSVPLGNFGADGAGPSHAGHAAIDGESGYDVLDDDVAKNLTWESLAAIRSWSGLPLVVKGILTAEDAALAVDHGVDAIVVSNHGGRQLDRVRPAIEALADIVAAVPGGTEIWVDGGVRRGLDVAIALGLGARGVLVGRPILWALAAGGQAGVERALAILREEFEIAMRLLGTPTTADISSAHVEAQGR
jgi:4-hydroxymandelate oxidase